MEWQIKQFNELSVQELYQIYYLRTQVFVVEQACAYQEVDDLDLLAWHLFAYNEQSESLLAYGRIIVKADCVQIGRVIIADSYRHQGLGSQLLHELIRQAEALGKGLPLFAQAQAHLQKFYEMAGFIVSGDVYLEDGIAHIDMWRMESTAK